MSHEYSPLVKPLKFDYWNWKRTLACEYQFLRYSLNIAEIMLILTCGYLRVVVISLCGCYVVVISLYYLRVVVNSFSMGLCKSTFSTYILLVKLGFPLSVFWFSCFCIFSFYFFCSLFWIQRYIKRLLYNKGV